VSPPSCCCENYSTPPREAAVGGGGVPPATAGSPTARSSTIPLSTTAARSGHAWARANSMSPVALSMAASRIPAISEGIHMEAPSRSRATRTSANPRFAEAGRTPIPSMPAAASTPWAARLHFRVEVTRSPGVLSQTTRAK